MKTLELIEILEEKEKKLLAKKLKTNPRHSLLKLFQELTKKTVDTYDKAAVYKTVFGVSYKLDKDYLLRNELRLLNAEIELFIIENTTEVRLDQQLRSQEIVLLHRLLRQGKESLFQKYYIAAVSSAKEMHNFELLSELYSLKCKFLIKYKEISVANYKELVHTLKLEQNAVQSHLEEKQSENFVKLKYAQRVLLQLDEKAYQQELDSPERMPLSEEANLLVEYNSLIAQSYLLKGSQKIETLLKAKKLQPNVSAIRPEKTKDMLTILGNIAVEYFLNEKFEEAHKYYAEATALMNETNLNIELLFNYCTNALVLGHHFAFIQTAEKYHAQISSNLKLRYRFQYFTAIAYLFDKKPEKAFDLLGQDIAKRPETEYYFYRMVYAMVYFQLNDFDLATRELENIAQSFRFRKDSIQQDKPLVKIMQKLLLICSYQNNPKKYKHELTAFQENYKNTLAKMPQFSTIIYTWVQWQVTQRLNSAR